MDKIIIDSSDLVQFGDVLGGLMGAVIEAQTQAARATAEFITNVGTTEQSIEGDAEHEFKTLSFKYSKRGADGEPAEFILKIPLLSMVEIPAISIKAAKFSFYYDVKTTIDSTSKETINPLGSTMSGSQSGGQAKLNLFKSPTKLIGRVNKETNSTSQIEKNAGIKVDIEFEKSAITVGLDRIIDMLELAAKEEEVL